MMVFKLALKNLIHAGLRTWLTSFMLGLTLFFMLFMQSMMDGMLDEMSVIRTNEEIGGGQVWHEMYDPFDPTVLEEANAALPTGLQAQVDSGEACPLLILPGAMYPKGRFKNALFKGVNPTQECLQLDFTPLGKTDNKDGELSVMVGRRYANQLGLVKGDMLTLRWRTQAGAFNALDAKIVALLETNAPIMDQGQIYLSHEAANRMNGTKDHSTFVWVKEDVKPAMSDGWIFRDFYYMMKDTYDMIQTKKVGQSIFYGMLLMLGLVAIFDTQLLAVFRRKKEIGTFMALGMSNSKVVYMFVMEGMMHGILATFLVAVLGGPLFYDLAVNGMSMMGISGDDFGMAFGDRFYLVFNPWMVIISVLFVNLMVLFVSFWPTRVITKMTPADSLRGRTS